MLNPSSKLNSLEGEFMNENSARYFILYKFVVIKLKGIREVKPVGKGACSKSEKLDPQGRTKSQKLSSDPSPHMHEAHAHEYTENK